jgi:hypothetical protein
MGGVCSTNEEKSKAYRFLVGKLEKETTRKPRTYAVDNIKMDLGEIGCGCAGWVGLAQYRDKWRALVNSVLNLRVP